MGTNTSLWKLLLRLPCLKVCVRLLLEEGKLWRERETDVIQNPRMGY